MMIMRNKNREQARAAGNSSKINDLGPPASFEVTSLPIQPQRDFPGRPRLQMITSEEDDQGGKSDHLETFSKSE
jgi:hypothetical protein